MASSARPHDNVNGVDRSGSLWAPPTLFPMSSCCPMASFAACMPMPYRLAMMTRRLHAPLFVAGLLLLFVAAAAGAALTARPTSTGLALDPNIPNERALIALGLSGAPGPGEPTHPIAVDRVLVDGAATYVQFHRVCFTRVGAVAPPLPRQGEAGWAVGPRVGPRDQSAWGGGEGRAQPRRNTPK